MSKSLMLGRIAGIRIQVHWTFSLIIAWILLTGLIAGKGLVAALSSVAFVLVLFGCVVLHELGHALAARMYGIPTSDITLLPIGGVARLERMPRKPSQELVVALAGPAVNIVIAAVLFVLLVPVVGIANLTSTGLGGGTFLQQLIFVNLALVVFNLLPAFPMDGGRVVRALLAMFMDYVRATRVSSVVSVFPSDSFSKRERKVEMNGKDIRVVIAECGDLMLAKECIADLRAARFAGAALVLPVQRFMRRRPSNA